jgi:DNA-directed RNA polymerase subunit RPC12/RpoP
MDRPAFGLGEDEIAGGLYPRLSLLLRQVKFLFCIFSGSYDKTMADYTEKNCPKCGQTLRFPKNIGGMVMACPSCGNKFHSDFKLGKAKRRGYREFLIYVFEMPDRVLRRIVRFFTS